MYDLEEVVQGFVRPVDLSEPARRASQQQHPGFGLKRLPQTPSRIVVLHVGEDHVQVLYDEHKALVVSIRKVQQRAQATVLQGLVVVFLPDVRYATLKVRFLWTVRHLVGQM